MNGLPGWKPEEKDCMRRGLLIFLGVIGFFVLVALLITWFAFYVVYRLVHEDK